VDIGNRLNTIFKHKKKYTAKMVNIISYSITFYIFKTKQSKTNEINIILKYM